jgi:hypothetical protein
MNAALPHAALGKGLPHYELYALAHGPDDLELEVWQLPAVSTPHIKSPLRIAGLRGRNMALVEHRVLRRLAKAGMRLGQLPNVKSKHKVSEDLAMNLGLLFRVLAPMRNATNMRQVTEGIERMGLEEAAYWLGMSMHRKNPRRVLMALRFLLIEPDTKAPQK